MKPMPPQYRDFMWERNRLVMKEIEQGGLEPEEAERLERLRQVLDTMEMAQFFDPGAPVWFPN